MQRFSIVWTIVFTCLFTVAYAQQKKAAFRIIPLGVYGGVDESNLSSYMVAAKGTSEYICFDAGTLHAGIEKAVQRKSFSTEAGSVLKTNVKGYLISHPHLDHLAGLVINSPDDTAKNIYGLPFCLEIISDKYFSWKSWANFGDTGEKPVLKKYHYVPLVADSEAALVNTKMYVKAFELAHSSPGKSTAFLVRSNNAYVLYLGDTGADEIERSTRLGELWKSVAPLIQAAQLKGIFIETSFPDSQAKDKLFGHLTPRLLMQEMDNLAMLCGKEKLSGFPIVITHIKPSGNNEAMIQQELKQQNKLQLKLIFPKQAQAFDL